MVPNHKEPLLFCFFLQGLNSGYTFVVSKGSNGHSRRPKLAQQNDPKQQKSGIMVEANSLARLVEKSLPAMSGSKVSYNSKNNIFLTSGYTSAAGNTYYQGIRLSDRIVVKYDLGQGYKYLFLNGIQIYGFNGTGTTLLASRAFLRTCFDESLAKRQCVDMVMSYLKGQMKLAGTSVSELQLSQFADSLVGEAMRNQPKQLA